MSTGNVRATLQIQKSYGLASTNYQIAANFSATANGLIEQVGTIAPNGNVVIDLSAVLAKYRTIFLKNTTSTSGKVLQVGGGTTPVTGYTNAVTVGAGGIHINGCPLDGMVVTPSTACNLKLANPDGAVSVSYELMCFGDALSMG